MDNTILAITLLPQIPHESILLLNSSPSDPLNTTFVFLMFEPLHSSASFQFQSLFFQIFHGFPRQNKVICIQCVVDHLLAFFVIPSTTIANNSSDRTDPAPINSRLNVVVRSPTRWGRVEIAVGLPEGSNYPGRSQYPIIFFAVLPSERPLKGSTKSF